MPDNLSSQVRTPHFQAPEYTLTDEETVSDDEWCEVQGISPEPDPEEGNPLSTYRLLTDVNGDWCDGFDGTEPAPASVVLIMGPSGTAYQRFHYDGAWRSTRDKGGPKTWEWLCTKRLLCLVYEAQA